MKRLLWSAVFAATLVAGSAVPRAQMPQSPVENTPRSVEAPPRVRVGADPISPRDCPAHLADTTLQDGPRTCACPAAATSDGSVWGTDVYTADSQICRAALHAGAVSSDGGLVTLMPEPGRGAYRGSTRHGVESQDYAEWPTSYRFAQPGELSPEQQVLAAERCPVSLSGEGAALVPGGKGDCICPASATTRGEVWGTLIYTSDSAICAAALHAGAVEAHGGRVTLVVEPGRRAYRGSLRNGVNSADYGPWDTSFRFEGTDVAPLESPAQERLRIR